MRSFRSVRGEEEAAAREGVCGGGGGGGEAPRAAVVDSGVWRGPERILRAADRFGVGTRGGVAARCCEREKGRWLVEAAAAVLDEEAALRWNLQKDVYGRDQDIENLRKSFNIVENHGKSTRVFVTT